MTRLARTFLAPLCALALTAAASAADENKVIFPGGGGASSSSSSTAASGSGGLGNVTLVIGLVLAAAGGWFVWRGRLAAPLGKKTQELTIGETRSLGNRQYLVVASYQDKKFLLGVCPGRIDMLAPLHDAPPGEPRL